MNDNNSNSSNSSPAKKRKANDGRAAATDSAHDVCNGNTNDGGGFLSSWFGYFSGRSDGASSGSPRYENSIHHSLSQINSTMTRMEEKLAAVSSLERRCEQLEKKCSSLETMLESTKEHINKKFVSLHSDLDRKCGSLAERLEAKVDAVHKQADKALKRHEFNEMMLKNQSWEYSADEFSVDDLEQSGYTLHEIHYLTDSAEELKDLTTTLRRGVFPCGKTGIHLEMSDYVPFSYEVNNELLPHWREFAAALEQFTPAINVLPDNCENSFRFYDVQLNPEAMFLIKKALMGKPFQRLAFTNFNNNHDNDGGNGGMSVDAILDIVESNKHLRNLEIGGNHIGRQHIERLCSAVHNHHLVQLDLSESLEAGVADNMLASLLIIDDLKLEKLDLWSTNITTVGSTLLAEFLATNPRLKELIIGRNNFNDSDAEMIANALRSNKTLRQLSISGNRFTKIGVEDLLRAVYDDSSLNAAADTNHVCSIDVGPYSYGDCIGLNQWNLLEEEHINRGMKIYNILSPGHTTKSSAHHFGEIDLKILPNLLVAVQEYLNAFKVYLKEKWQEDPKEYPLSIVYEIFAQMGQANTSVQVVGG